MLVTREDVTRAIDGPVEARPAAAIDDAIAGASDDAETHCHRKFRPVTETRQFDYPSSDVGRATWFSLDLGEDELIEATAVTSGGQAIAVGDIVLRPNSGPPYNRLELDRSTTASFAYTTGTWQNTVAITGVWGYQNKTRAAGTLAAAVTTPTATTIDVTDGTLIGVGDVAYLDGTERVQVTGRSWLDLGLTLTAALTAEDNSTTVDVGAGHGLIAGETIRVGGERMFVTDVSTSTVSVVRADNGVLAAHTIGAAVEASRRFTIERAVGGTSASTHPSGATIATHVVPPAVRKFVIASALSTLGVFRSAGSTQGLSTRGGGSGPRAAADALGALRDVMVAGHGRRTRHAAI